MMLVGVVPGGRLHRPGIQSKWLRVHPRLLRGWSGSPTIFCSLATPERETIISTAFHSAILERSFMSHETIEHPSPIPAPPHTACCLHSRLIDDVLNKAGKPTGRVRCLECGAVFRGPRKGLK